MKKYKFFIVFILIVIFFSSCENNFKHKKYQKEFYNLFNTSVYIILYTENEQKFDEYSNFIYNRLQELNNLFDIYKNYEGINNIKTINDNAGIKPIEVSKEIIDLIDYSKDVYTKTSGTVNIAMGAVLGIWHEYRENGNANPDSAELPHMDILKQAYKYTNINSIIVDKNMNTVYIDNPKVSIDVGAVAKGYAVEIIAKELIDKGVSSGLINVGGNIRAIGKQGNGKDWGIGIQNPDIDENNSKNIIDSIFIQDKAVVSSGNYMRYYIVDGKYYNHIIDSKTLMPANKFKSVTVINDNSAEGDFLSTALFVLNYEEGLKLIKEFNAEAMWVFNDNTIKVTDGYKELSKNF